MTGKELLIILGGATVLGGGAGAAAVLLTPAPIAPAPAPASVADAKLQARLEDLDKEVRASRAALDEVRASVVAMTGRVEEWVSRSVPRSPDAGEDHPGVLVRDRTWEDEDGVLVDGVKAGIDVSQNSLEGARLKFRLQDAGIHSTIGGEIVSGLRLRMLPEEERWAKAKDELGLDDSQIQSIKDAAAERDRAIEDALVTENVSVGGDGGEITVRKLDPERAADANRAYRERVNGNLTADQQKTWKEKGYDHAFGRTPMGSHGEGGSSVMTLTIQSDQNTTIPLGSDEDKGSDGE